MRENNLPMGILVKMIDFLEEERYADNIRNLHRIHMSMKSFIPHAFRRFLSRMKSSDVTTAQ